jgi:hypothetical protein
MELESLKYIWHSLETPPAQTPDRQKLLALLAQRYRGRDAIARMRRNLIVESIVLGATYIPAIALYWLAFEGRLALIGWLFLLLAAGFFIGYYRTYRLLGQMQCMTSEVRTNLARQITMLKKYIRFYLLGGTGMVPVMFLLCYAILRWKRSAAFVSPGHLTPAASNLYLRLHPMPWWGNPVFWGSLMVLLTIGIYYANARYLNRLYGRHIKKLQELLREMDTE